jgi:hypothetical protein
MQLFTLKRANYFPNAFFAVLHTTLDLLIIYSTPKFYTAELVNSSNMTLYSDINYIPCILLNVYYTE